MRTASLHCVLGMAAILAACGQKGPLVLPDAQHAHRKLGVPKPSAPMPAPAPPQTAAPATGSAGTLADPPPPR